MYFAVLTKRRIIAIVILAVSVIAVLGSIGGAIGTMANGKKKELPIYSVETKQKKVAISFDCAWGVDYTDSLLSTMQSLDVKCTFFMVKFWAEKYPEYVRKIYDHGHEIGTHSSTHPYMSKLSKDKITKELNDSIRVIESITKEKVTLFRPPYGDYNDLVIQTARELGLYTIQWSVDSLDWKNITAGEIEKRVVERVKNGSIVLFHNQGLHTSEALPKIITALKSKGYEFVPIGELIYKDGFRMESDGTQVKIP